jgi:hypothetical protein
MEKTKIAIRITVNDEGYLDKDVTVNPALEMTSEEVANVISDLIDKAFIEFADQNQGAVIIV